jgi:hypothetical protein
MDEKGLGQRAVEGAATAGVGGLVVLSDLVLAAHGVPPVTAPGLAAGHAVVLGARATFNRGVAEIARVMELASGLPLDTALERLGADDDASAGLFAALNALLDRPGRERATLLGAVLGEMVSDATTNEQDALRALLDLALGLQVGHLRLLQLLNGLRGDTEPGRAWVLAQHIYEGLPGMEKVLGGLIAACVANGTIRQRQAEGLSYGASAHEAWSITELGVTVTGFLTKYAPAD